MASHGHVRGLREAIADSGGVVSSSAEFDLPSNPLNPTWVIEVDAPPGDHPPSASQPLQRQCPITQTPLVQHGAFLYAPSAGLAYPILDGIPILRIEHAILVSSFPKLNSTP
jgi:hypothetical protein